MVNLGKVRELNQDTEEERQESSIVPSMNISSQKEPFLDFGPATVCLRGEGILFDALRRFHFCQHSAKRNNVSVPFDIVLTAMDHSPSKDSFQPLYRSGIVTFDERDLQFETPLFVSRVTSLFDRQSPSMVKVYPRQPLSISRVNAPVEFFRRLKRPSFEGRTWQTANSIMSYSLFWFVLHSVLLKKDAAFLHGSTIDWDGKAVILTGTGGCGKTSTAFKLLEDPQAKYLSEDFSILSNTGSLYYNPKLMSIYGSDTRNDQKILIDYVENRMSIMDRLHWKWTLGRRNGNPLRKISPEEALSPDRICKRSDIDSVYYLVRSREKEISHREIGIHELAQRCSDASLRELKTLIEILLLIKATAPQCDEYMTIADLTKQTERVYKAAFGFASRLLLIRIPEESKPAEVSGYLSKHGLLPK
jgi:hypothetical protein